MHDVIVIGAGVSGLTVARDLADLGRDVVVLEREVRAGGKIVSERFDGFLFEHGPTTLNAAHPAAEAIVRQLGLDKDRIDLDRGPPGLVLFFRPRPRRSAERIQLYHLHLLRFRCSGNGAGSIAYLHADGDRNRRLN